MRPCSLSRLCRHVQVYSRTGKQWSPVASTNRRAPCPLSPVPQYICPFPALHDDKQGGSLSPPSCIKCANPVPVFVCICVVRDSNSVHQLLLPPANCCPIFASRTTQGEVIDVIHLGGAKKDLRVTYALPATAKDDGLTQGTR